MRSTGASTGGSAKCTALIPLIALDGGGRARHAEGAFIRQPPSAVASHVLIVQNRELLRPHHGPGWRSLCVRQFGGEPVMLGLPVPEHGPLFECFPIRAREEGPWYG